MKWGASFTDPQLKQVHCECSFSHDPVLYEVQQFSGMTFVTGTIYLALVDRILLHGLTAEKSFKDMFNLESTVASIVDSICQGRPDSKISIDGCSFLQGGYPILIHCCYSTKGFTAICGYSHSSKCSVVLDQFSAETVPDLKE